ncbi:glutathione S-transferase family protein [Anabaena sp. WFMT]|uniref:glutathione S-transferase family protein n=1 Tax=Anabaena sp. WFMT TaxID=3449730 RepID=UPI003F1E85B5
MLKLYHEPISPNSRRVWITLIEKGLDFELVKVKLNGEQFKPDFLAISPFHHIPALVDDGFTMVESLAILDYLEVKYPTPAMLPKDAKDLAIVRMVEMVSVNELLPDITPLMPVMLGLPGGDPEQIEQTKQKIATALNLFENLLDHRPYFGSKNLTLAEAVAGSIVTWLPKGDVSLDGYPKLSAWCDACGERSYRLIARPSWQTTQATPEMIEGFRTMLMAKVV